MPPAIKPLQTAFLVRPDHHAEQVNLPIFFLLFSIVLVTSTVLFLPVAADDSDSSAGAHVHDPLADGTKLAATSASGFHPGGVASTSNAAAKALEAGGLPVPPAATAAFHDEGSIDLDAYLEEDASAEADYSHPTPHNWDDTADGQQLPKMPSLGGTTSSAANASAAAARTAGKRMGWMDRDLSLLLDANYRVYIQQVCHLQLCGCCSAPDPVSHLVLVLWWCSPGRTSSC